MLLRSVASVIALGTLAGAAVVARRAPGDVDALAAERVQPNDNRRPAGTLRDGVLALRLEARVADWHPDGDDAPGAPMPAFAEDRGAATIPGPLVRVPAGTVVDVAIRNALADTLRLHGLHARAAEAAADTAPLVIAPGERRRARFRLDAPGTYLYWGTTERRAINFRTREDAQLSGAIVVDEAGAEPARDRVFVVGMWTDTVHRARTRRQRVLGVINGRSWPHTERLTHAVGDTVRWRVVNASADLHPMHLHGFYFRVDSRGDGTRDTMYAAGERPLAVTESMAAGSTLRLTWVPERPGNWLFHCHVPEHFGPRGALGLARAAGATTHGDHAVGGMSGLVLGVAVRPAPGASRASAPDAHDQRRLRLLVRPNVGSTEAAPIYGYALHEGGAEPPPDSGVATGPPLDLERGRPVRITVVNRLAEPTAVHWHGIELESYFDGVPGFSGAGGRVTPLVAPGDSFEVRFTPPRAGTFIYHTHADEERQQQAGLAGAIVVSEPGVPRDPATDIPLVLTTPAGHGDEGLGALVNGSATPAPIRMRVGRSYRLRLVQMSASRSQLRVELRHGDSLATWRRVAKDGAELPPAARRDEPGRTALGIGETYDIEVTPDRAGPLRLEVRLGPRPPARSILLTTVPIVVEPR